MRLANRPSAWVSLAAGAGVGILGGLIGLGGAEFRLPVLVGLLGLSARQAVPVNLAVSFAVLAAALPARAATLTLRPVLEGWEVVGLLLAGGLLGAFLGPAILGRLRVRTLERLLLVALVGIGGLLIGEGLIGQEQSGGVIPGFPGWQTAALGFGIGIGLVSSLLGVAGGELIIPTLVLGFGFDIKAAGTASLVISLPTVLMGLGRYAAAGILPTGGVVLKQVVLPMAAGSILGGVVGGSLVGFVPGQVLKVILGLLLIGSAVRVFARERSHSREPGQVISPGGTQSRPPFRL